MRRKVGIFAAAVAIALTGAACSSGEDAPESADSAAVEEEVVEDEVVEEDSEAEQQEDTEEVVLSPEVEEACRAVNLAFLADLDSVEEAKESASEDQQDAAKAQAFADLWAKAGKATDVAEVRDSTERVSNAYVALAKALEVREADDSVENIVAWQEAAEAAAEAESDQRFICGLR